MRNLGEMAEGVLIQWAGEVGITANKSIRDRTGWDYLLEFPLQAEEGEKAVPLDRQPPPVNCLLQVKGTDLRRRRISIKLSNWTRLASSALPAFFLVLEFDGEASPQRAFLLHFWEREIRRIKQRLRELSSTKTEVRLNQHRMVLRYGDEHALEDCGGRFLAAAILRNVHDPGKYVDEKVELLDSVGYEGARWEAEIQLVLGSLEEVAGKDPEDILIDLALGRIPYLPIAPGGKIWDLRFGLRASEPLKVFETEGRLELGDQERLATGRLDFSRGVGRRVSIPVDVYFPSGVAHLVQKERIRIRLTAPGIDVIVPVFRRGAGEFNLRPATLTGERALSELWPSANVMLFLTELVENEEADIKLLVEGKHIGTIRIKGVAEAPRPVVDWAQCVRDAYRIAQYCDIYEVVRVTEDDLVGQQKQLEFARRVLRGDLPNPRLTFSTPTGIVPGTYCAPDVKLVQLGNYWVVLGLAYVGDLDKKYKSYEEVVLPLTSVKIVSVHWFHSDEKELLKPKEVYDAVMEECSGIGEMLELH